MTTYVGIDLGTTNSAICSFDGQEVALYKSPEQTDVTPSAIFIDKRGNRFVGMRAYGNAAKNPDNAATLFKRLIGTSTPIKLPGAGLTMTPEECSAEILRTLFGYLPEALRNDPDVGTVITVPAAFNQMQKDATTDAARSAGLGKVALMQEPVAAVMSVMRARKGDGTFLVYDLGGGTLDIAIAQSSGGRVSLLGQGGVPMCGGRDFDRRIFDNVVAPWLQANFDLPDNFGSDPAYKALRRMAEHTAEKAKIELSAREEAIISADEDAMGIKDRSGKEIYLDLPITRAQVDGLIEDKIEESVKAARETIERAGLSVHDIERMVFVGGPTQYKPLRDRVAFELGVAPSTDVNPMTAVASGAAVFAEAIDWSSQSRARKSSRGTISAGSDFKLTVNYAARTPDQKAKVALKLGQPALLGSEFQVDSLDTGWSSGRAALRDGAIMEVPLTRGGDNTFKIFVFDPQGGAISLAQDRIVIARTAATIDAIPASHSIGVEARQTVGGPLVLEYLVRAGDQLPKKGRITFKAESSLKAGSPESLKFKLWEGDIQHPYTSNHFIGMFEISGTDFDNGIVVAGADLNMTFTMLDSGAIEVEIDIPSVGGSFRSGNFYSRQSGMVDFSAEATRIKEDAQDTAKQITDLSSKVGTREVAEAREQISHAINLDADETDPEVAKQASEHVQAAKRLLADARKSNLQIIRRGELEDLVAIFENSAKAHARPSEIASFEKLKASAESKVGTPGQQFESILSEMGSKIFAIFSRQDWFIVDRFNLYVQEWAHLFADRALYNALIEQGKAALAANDVDRLRQVVIQLDLNRIKLAGADDLVAAANIVLA